LLSEPRLLQVTGKRGLARLSGGVGVFEEFGLLPERFHLGAGDPGESGALSASKLFHFAETAGEFRAGFSKSDFGIDIQETSEVHGDKEDVAEFGLDGGMAELLRG
jgi:hypothetical protein